ncbi:hypothetical protein NDA00_25870 [Funiculus sociatus GB2-M2]|uniref:hypothetical protein n=1 Tax=Funiculus sociatus TaxID=450527 RepID=UPI00329A64B2
MLAYEAQVRTTLPQKKADATWAQVRTALWRYTLPAWGLPLPQGQRLTQEEYEQGLDFLKQLPLERLKDAFEAQEGLFEQLDVAGNSRRNYRWALKSFIQWCQQQSWFETEVKVEVEANVQPSASRKRQRKPSANEVRLTTRQARQPYRLPETERSEALQQELEKFSQFLTEPRPNNPDLQGVKPQTAKQYLNQVLRILGWLHAHQKVPLQEISLRRFVEVSFDSVEREQNDLRSQANAEGIVEVVQAYLQWLRTPEREKLDERSEAIQSPYTDIKVVNTWIVVAQFFYHQSRTSEGKEVEKAKAVISALEEVRRGVTPSLKVHQPVSDPSKTQLEWYEFLDLVEKLRGQCVSRFHQGTQSKQSGTTLGPQRSLTAISQSYQRFLLGAFLAYIPPQRSQVLRHLVISYTLPPKQPFKFQESFDWESILYQDQDMWWISILNGSKNGSKYRELSQLGFVPNLGYPEGRCFYQYLEEWLLHYVYKDSRGKTVEVPGLRSCFKPHHSYLFTMKNGKPYEDSLAFSMLLRHPAYRLTEKAISFEVVRRTYSKYLEDDGKYLKDKEKYLRHKESKESSGLKSSAPLWESECKPITRAVDSLESQKEDKYNAEDWRKAGEVAQAFLDGRMEGCADDG